jgi:hypothetical protein
VGKPGRPRKVVRASRQPPEGKSQQNHLSRSIAINQTNAQQTKDSRSNDGKTVKHHLTNKSAALRITMVRRLRGAWKAGVLFPGSIRTGRRFDLSDFDAQVAARAADDELSGNGARRPQTAGRKNWRTPLIKARLMAGMP